MTAPDTASASAPERVRSIQVRIRPYAEMRYETCGDWIFTPDGHLIVTVAEMADERHGWLLAIHEIAEALLCRHRGISQEAVDAFDLAYAGGGEPGADQRAPYVREHVFATRIEKKLAVELDVDWEAYEQAIGDLGE